MILARSLLNLKANISKIILYAKLQKLIGQYKLKLEASLDFGMRTIRVLFILKVICFSLKHSWANRIIYILIIVQYVLNNTLNNPSGPKLFKGCKFQMNFQITSFDKLA